MYAYLCDVIETKYIIERKKICVVLDFVLFSWRMSEKKAHLQSVIMNSLKKGSFSLSLDAVLYIYI